MSAEQAVEQIFSVVSTNVFEQDVHVVVLPAQVLQFGSQSRHSEEFESKIYVPSLHTEVHVPLTGSNLM